MREFPEKYRNIKARLTEKGVPDIAIQLLENYCTTAKQIGNGTMLREKLIRLTASDPETQKKVTFVFDQFCEEYNIPTQYAT